MFSPFTASSGGSSSSKSSETTPGVTDCSGISLNVDNETLEAIVLCQLADIEELETHCKGKGKEGEARTNDQAAFSIGKEALQRVLQVLIDGRMAECK